MADTKINQTPENMKQDESNQKLRSEANQGDNQPKSAVGGERGEQSKTGEKSAIGGGSTGTPQFGGQTGNQPGGSQTGEPGRARNELDQDKSRGETDKNRSEPTGQQR